MRNPKPKILLVIPHLHAARDVFLSDFLPKLSERFDIEISSKLSENIYLQEICKDRKIPFHTIGHFLKPNINLTFFRRINFLVRDMGRKILAHRAKINTLLVNEAREKLDTPWKYYKKWIIWKLFFQHDFLFRRLLKLNDSFLNIDYSQELLWQVDPDIVLFYDVFAGVHKHFFPIMREHRAKFIAQIRSWDNLSAKGVLEYEFDSYLVWNRYMKDELLDYYDDISEDQIGQVGAIYFDCLALLLAENSDASFRYKSQLQGRRLISFMLSYPDLKPTYMDYIQILTDAIESGDLPEDIILLVRIQPGPRSAGIEKKLSQFEGKVIIDKPAGDMSMNSPELWKDELVHYAKVLENSEVIINFTSTTTIDAAVINRPNVTIGFDVDPVENYYFSMKRFLDRTHIQWILENEGNQIAETPRDLIEKINLYLTSPDSQESGRKNIVRHLCHDLVGIAHEEMITFLYSQVDSQKYIIETRQDSI